MKAAQITQYGGPETIHLNENTPKPIPKEGQILVAVSSASINAFDWKIRSGMYQKMMPLQFPFTMGGDYTGKVVEVGQGVSDFTIGEEVYGQAIILNGGTGTMAEFVAANTKNSAMKPKSANFVEAGALPLVGVSALQALEDHIKLKSGQKILIQGGAGGIGHIAIQIAKALGAYVATTVKTADTDFVKELGADVVIDYTSQKFEDILTNYDAVFDTVGGETADKSFLVLKKGGVLVSMLGQPDEALAKKHEVTAIGEMTHTDTAHLKRLGELVDNGKVTINIDKTFPLENTREAFSYQEKNHPKGKVVIKIT